jgi:hypothetical protein
MCRSCSFVILCAFISVLVGCMPLAGTQSTKQQNPEPVPASDVRHDGFNPAIKLTRQ